MSTPSPSFGPEDLDMGLRFSLSGTLAMPHNPEYTTLKTWNTSVDVQPAAVVFVENAADVSTTLHFAVEHGLKVAVQGSGHGAVALSSDVLLVDTSRLQHCVVDPHTQTARIGAGVLARTLLDAAAPMGWRPSSGRQRQWEWSGT